MSHSKLTIQCTLAVPDPAGYSGICDMEVALILTRPKVHYLSPRLKLSEMNVPFCTEPFSLNEP